MPDLRFRRSEKMPSSNFFEFLTGRPKAWKRKERQRTMSVPEMWKRLFLQPCCQPVHRMRIPHRSLCAERALSLASTQRQRSFSFFSRLGGGGFAAYHSTQDTYSPVGSRNRRMY